MAINISIFQIETPLFNYQLLLFCAHNFFVNCDVSKSKLEEVAFEFFYFG